MSATPAPADRRPYQVCHSSTPLCPRCNQVLRRVRPGIGSMYAHCDNDELQPARGAGGLVVRRQVRCGQHVHILGCPESVCIVTPITRLEFEQLTAEDYATASVVYVTIGVLVR